MGGTVGRPGGPVLRLAGGFELHDQAGRPVEISSRRARALLAYLYLAPGQSARRERLCGLLWSDRAEAQARASLRQCLFELRERLAASGLDLLDVGREKIALRPGSLHCDVTTLELALASGDFPSMASLPALLTGGRLLEGLDLGGLFQDWRDQASAQHEQAIASGVQVLLRRLTAAEQWREVRLIADAFLQRDPLDEAAVAAAIRADRAVGNAAGAHRRFLAFKAALRKDLGAEPGPAIIEAIGADAPPKQRATVPVAPEQALADRAAAGAPPSSGRRRLTVLASDLIHPDPLVARLDPEDRLAATARFRRDATAAVVRFGGHVADVRGDRLVAYFGFPEALEDAAERAVRAGLAIVEAVASPVGASVAGAHSVRVGVHAGVVVVTEGGEGEAEVFGDVSQIAAVAAAEADTSAVVITGEVQSGVASLVVSQPMPALRRDGAGDALRLYRVTSVQPASGRGFTPARATPFIGREDELKLLERRWEQVRDGHGQLVLVTGEAGIGKSRLVAEFKSLGGFTPDRWLECGGGQLVARSSAGLAPRLPSSTTNWCSGRSSLPASAWPTPRP